MKRVVFLIPTLRGGGAERVMVTLLRNLDASAFGSTLVVVDGRESTYRDELPPHVDVVDLASSRVRYALPRLVSLLRCVRPDVVFSTLGHLNLAIALARPLLPNDVRYVARETAVVTENLRTSRWPRLWGWLYRMLYRRFDCVVCQSRHMRKDLVENFHLPYEKTTLIHNPVDLARIAALSKQPMPFEFGWAPSSGGLRLLAVGRLAPEKGLDLLIEAVAALDDTRTSVVIVGDGPLRRELEQLAFRLCVAHRVRFAGFQSNPYPFIARADALVLSSRFEGLPNVVLEALACGTPVVATPAPGGVREILENVPECVIADDISARALAAAIQAWCEGSRARVAAERVAPFEVARIVAQYEAVLSGGGGTARDGGGLSMAKQAATGSANRLVLFDAAVWYLLVALCLLYPLSLDRTRLMDNDSYLDYFVNGRDFAWIRLFTEAESWLQLFFRVSTEEALWLVWTSLAGWLWSR